MKSTRILMMAFVAMLSVGLVSCDKESNDNGSGNGGNNGGDNPGGGDNTPAGWVDLGLPSGLLWAECNLGANAPEEYGDYYAWGETQSKEVYNWDTYRYGMLDDEGNLTLTKYNSGSLHDPNDNLTTLEAMDDAATAILGNGVRTPTKAEWEELISKTTVEWTTVNGVNGRKFTATNGKTLFLPAAGGHFMNGFHGADREGHYWSSSLQTSSADIGDAWSFFFFSDNQFMEGEKNCVGYPVRAVRQK